MTNAGGLREMSWLSELLNIQGFLVLLVALEGAVGGTGRCSWWHWKVQHASEGQATDLYFPLTRIGSTGLFFNQILQLPLMQNPDGLLASGRISPSGAAIPARSAPCLGLLGWAELCARARTSSPLSARSGTRKACFYQWFEFLNLGLTSGDKIRHWVFHNTHRRVLFFWSLWNTKRHSVAQLHCSGLQNDETGKFAMCTELSYSWKFI